MNVFTLAQRYGVAIAFADLGDWGADELRSEYDPHEPAIRLNLRVARTLPPHKLGEYVVLAIAHELYHHRERLGEVAVIADRAARERAADDFARALLANHS
jgi:hypothetical protein